MNKCKAFIFDLDGVITDTAEFHYLAWRALASDIGILFTEADNEQLKGISRMESLEKIIALGQRQEDFSDIQKQQLAERKNKHYQALIRQISPADILPGIRELIVEIKEHGYKLGLASVSKNAFAVMDSLQLSSQFDYLVDASTIVNGKPNPEIFLRAAENLGVEPSVCIGIEDAAAGITSIKEAGMFAVGVGSAEILHQADLIVEDTSLLSLSTILAAYEQYQQR